MDKLLININLQLQVRFVYIPFVAFLDYNGTNQSLLFRAGENCADIEILDDFEVESAERFYTYLAITSITGVKVLHSCDYFDINDNDGE